MAKHEAGGSVAPTQFLVFFLCTLAFPTNEHAWATLLVTSQLNINTYLCFKIHLQHLRMCWADVALMSGGLKP